MPDFRSELHPRDRKGRWRDIENVRALGPGQGHRLPNGMHVSRGSGAASRAYFVSPYGHSPGVSGGKERFGSPEEAVLRAHELRPGRPGGRSPALPPNPSPLRAKPETLDTTPPRLKERRHPPDIARSPGRPEDQARQFVADLAAAEAGKHMSGAEFSTKTRWLEQNGYMAPDRGLASGGWRDRLNERGRALLTARSPGRPAAPTREDLERMRIRARKEEARLETKFKDHSEADLYGVAQHPVNFTQRGLPVSPEAQREADDARAELTRRARMTGTGPVGVADRVETPDGPGTVTYQDASDYVVRLDAGPRRKYTSLDLKKAPALPLSPGRPTDDGLAELRAQLKRELEIKRQAAPHQKGMNATVIDDLRRAIAANSPEAIAKRERRTQKARERRARKNAESPGRPTKSQAAAQLKIAARAHALRPTDGNRTLLDQAREQARQAGVEVDRVEAAGTHDIPRSPESPGRPTPHNASLGAEYREAEHAYREAQHTGGDASAARARLDSVRDALNSSLRRNAMAAVAHSPGRPSVPEPAGGISLRQHGSILGPFASWDQAAKGLAMLYDRDPAAEVEAYGHSFKSRQHSRLDAREQRELVRRASAIIAGRSDAAA